MQLTGVCREEISDDKPIEFYCTKTGKMPFQIHRQLLLQEKYLPSFSARL